MPLPKPKKNEKQDDFINRCMSNETMKEEYEDNDERLAVCYSLWEQEKESKKEKPTNIERRIMSVEDVDMRIEGDDKPKIVGYAAKFNKWSEDLGGFREKIHPKAFDEVLDKADVRALKNHDPNLILGRTTSGTLSLKTNKLGLRFEIEPPNTSTGKDTVEEIRRKDITGCSFAFTTARDDWNYLEDGKVERTIMKVADLYDVGPVTYPAYPDTTVAARTLEIFKEQEKSKDEITDERKKDIERKLKRAEFSFNYNKMEIERMKSAED